MGALVVVHHCTRQYGVPAVAPAGVDCQRCIFTGPVSIVGRRTIVPHSTAIHPGAGILEHVQVNLLRCGFAMQSRRTPHPVTGGRRRLGLTKKHTHIGSAHCEHYSACCCTTKGRHMQLFRQVSGRSWGRSSNDVAEHSNRRREKTMPHLMMLLCVQWVRPAARTISSPSFSAGANAKAWVHSLRAASGEGAGKEQGKDN